MRVFFGYFCNLPCLGLLFFKISGMYGMDKQTLNRRKPWSGLKTGEPHGLF